MKKIVLFLSFLFIFTLYSCASGEIIVNKLTTTVTYVSNDDSNTIDKEEITKGSIITQTEKDYLKYDYEFDCWCIDQELTIPFDFSQKVTASISLYGKWNYVGSSLKEPTEIAITIDDLFSNSELMELQTNKVNYSTTFDTFIISGYLARSEQSADKIHYIKSQTNTKYKIRLKDYNIDFDNLGLHTNDLITLKCQISYVDELILINPELVSYEIVDHYYIVRDKDNNILNKYNQKEYPTIGDIPDQVKEDYYFKGYFYSKDLASQISSAASYKYDVNIYAKFEPIPYYYVSVHINDEVTKYKWVDDVSVNTLTEPSKDDYTFEGWYFDNEYQNKVPNDFNFSYDCDVYAYFKPIPYIYVTTHIDNETKTYKYIDSVPLSDFEEPNIKDTIFEGWYLESDYQNELSESYIIHETCDLYAKLHYIMYYDITFHIDGVVSKITILEDTSLNDNKVVNPVKTDYAFNGWYQEDTFINLVDADAKINSNLDLYAKFTYIERYVDVTLIIDGVSNTSSLVEKSIVSVINKETKEGYRFDGWYFNSDYTDKVADDYVITTSTTLYARYIKINYYNIKVHIFDNVTEINNQEENTVVLPLLTTPKKTGYSFLGWYLEDNYKTKIDNTYVLNSDIDVYASMHEILYYDVITYVNGVETTYSNIKENTKISSKIKDPALDDYYFKGWYKEADYKTKVSSSSKITSNLTLYAKLELIPYYDVNVYVDNLVVATYSIKEGTSISNITKPTKESDYYGNYTFSKFYLDSSFTKEAITSDTIKSNLDLYAYFNVEKKHYLTIYHGTTKYSTLKFVGDNHKLSEFNVSGAKPIAKKDANYEYTFDGWFFDLEYTKPVDDSFVFVDTDYTIYARLKATPLIDITYKVGDETKTERIVSGETTAKLTTPSLDGCDFFGWYYDDAYQKKIEATDKLTSSVTIYPLLKKAIVINAYYDNTSKGYNLYQGAFLSDIEIKEVKGKKFLGWYFDQTYTNAISNDYIFNETTNIYAKYQILKEYEITIYKDTTTTYGLNKSEKVTLYEDEPISKISKPTVAGYEFVGWYTSKDFNTLVDNSTLPSEGLTLYAKFNPLSGIKYTVRYYLEGEKTYQLINTLTFTGTTEETVYAEVDTVYNTIQNKEYYEYTIPSGKVNGNGNLVLEVYFNKCKYTIKYYVGDKVCYESDPIKWGEKVEFITNTAFEEEVGEAFISGWYKNNEFTEAIDYTVMIPGGINIYGDIELIYSGTEGITYILNETLDGYIVESYSGSETTIKVANGYLGLPVVEISDCAFYGLSNVTSIDLPIHLTKIGDKVFYGCSNLEIINLPDNITSIGHACFAGCEKLTEIILPSSLEYLGSEPFKECSNIKTISIDSNNQYYTTIDNVLYNESLSDIIYYASQKNDTSFTLSDKVINVLSNAFTKVKNLQTLVLTKVKKIDSYAINQCENLNSLTLNDEVETIATSFINNCTSLTTININNSNYYQTIDGILYNKDVTRLIYYPSGKINETYTLPETLRAIDSKAISYNKYLTKIVINDQIAKVSYLGFYYCENLTIELTIDTIPTRWSNVWYENIKEVKYVK